MSEGSGSSLFLLPFWNQLTKQIRATRVDQEALPNRFSSEQHPKAHRIAGRECQVDRPAFATKLDERANDWTVLSVAARAFDVAMFVKLCDAVDRRLGFALNGVDGESDEIPASAGEDLDVVGVQR